MQTISMTNESRASRAHDIWRQLPRSLDTMLAPRTVAVIGASESAGSIGRTILENLEKGGFEGAIYPVNPKHQSVLGVKAYRNITSVPEPIDLAVIVTPAQSVPAVVRECVQAGVPGAIIISAGFKETGPPGVALEQQMLAEANRSRMRIIGPNCLGVMRPHEGLNATFAAGMARPGSVGFISQSGALCTAILDCSLRENVGFSAFVSIGSMLDVDVNPLLASPERLLALDARILVHGQDVTENQLSKSAIRPYPTQYVTKWKLRDGTPVTLRPIRPEDES